VDTHLKYNIAKETTGHNLKMKRFHEKYPDKNFRIIPRSSYIWQWNVNGCYFASYTSDIVWPRGSSSGFGVPVSSSWLCWIHILYRLNVYQLNYNFLKYVKCTGLISETKCQLWHIYESHFFCVDFSRSGNNHLKIPGLFQVFHERANLDLTSI